MVTICITETDKFRAKKALALIFINGTVEYTEFDNTFRVPQQTARLLHKNKLSFQTIPPEQIMTEEFTQSTSRR
jgi:hypothetical protein